MNISTGFTNTLIQAFSWMLVHSLWQGALLAFAAGIVLMLTKKAGAAVRYNLVLALFAVFLVTAAFTFVYEYNNLQHEVAQYSVTAGIPVRNVVNNNGRIPIASTRIVSVAPVSKTYLSASNINVLLKSFSDYFSKNSFLIVMLWLVFFMAKSVSLAGNMLYMHRAKHYRVYAPDDHWKEKIASLCEKLQLKKAVLLLESGYIKVPVVIGYFKPVILVPVGLIAGIPAAQVEAVLLHELAHIKRNDYAVNFMQSIAEAVFFFNPALLWISKLLKEERENCCDDIAIAQTNNKEEFVQALISFKDYSVSESAYSVAFSGQKSTLLNRVTRIVYQENKTLSIKENGIFIAGIAMLLLTAFTVYPVKEAKWVKPIAALSKTVIRNINEQFKKPLKETNIGDVEAGTNKLTAANVTPQNVQGSMKLEKESVSALPQTKVDSTKLTFFQGIDNWGPNPLVIIDNKEYTKDILYKISRSCIAGGAFSKPGAAVKEYGPKASDGYIKLTTRQGQIVYMTVLEKENLIKENSVPKSKFYTRLQLQKNDGSLYDEIVLQVPSAPFGYVKFTLPHNGKAGFTIDNDYYDERDIQKLSPDIISSLLLADDSSLAFSQSYGLMSPVRTRYDVPGYDAVVDFKAIKKPTTPFIVDTVEFRATAYKVRENAVVVEQLKLMPGFKVNTNGALFYKDVPVTVLYLNNKPYASGNVKQGIENLPADIMALVQVMDAPGANSKTKMINVITKTAPRFRVGNLSGPG